MRDLKRYLNRRKISDVKSWVQSMGFNTVDDLVAFCEENMLLLNRDEYVTAFKHTGLDNSIPDPIPTSSDTSVIKTEVPQKVWHTPAAKRPLKKPTAVSPRSTKTEKASSRSKKES